MMISNDNETNQSEPKVFYQTGKLERVDADTRARVHSTESFGSVDGPGIRFIVFLKVAPCVVAIVIIQTHGIQRPISS